MVNNVANLVPPFEEDKEGKATYHGTSAAIEFGVNHLQVGNIIIMGHSECGGIRSLMDDSITKKTKGYSFIKPWMDIVQEANDFSRDEKNTIGKADRTMVCEKRAILVSLNNLATFPWVKEAVKSGTLKLHGWYYQINNGCLSEYNMQTDEFEEIV